MGNENDEAAPETEAADNDFDEEYDYDDCDNDLFLSGNGKKGRSRGGSKKHNRSKHRATGGEQRERRNSLKAMDLATQPLPPKQESVEKTSQYKVKEVRVDRKRSISGGSSTVEVQMIEKNISLNFVDDELSELFMEQMKVHGFAEENSSIENIGESILKSTRYFAWFFGNSGATSLKKFAEDCFGECLENKQFRQWFDLNCAKLGVLDPSSYYKQPLHPLHVTAKFTGGSESAQALSYFESVKNQIGKESEIAIVGLFFTERTFGLRVKLTKSQDLLFDEERKNSIRCRRTLSTSSVEEANPDVDQNSLVPKVLTRKNFKDQVPVLASKSYSGLRFQHQRQDFQPTKSRAHVTVGFIPKVKAMRVGEDLVDIVDLEGRSSYPHHDFEVPTGVLRQFGRHGDHTFVLYFNNRIYIQSIFMPSS